MHQLSKGHRWRQGAIACVLACASLSAQAQVPADQSAPGSLIGINPASGVPGSNRPSQAAAPVIGATAETRADVPFGGLSSPGSYELGSRPAPPQPLTLGIFNINAGGTFGTFFDDNVFALSANRRSDIAFFARPEISASAQGDGYGIQAAGFLEGRKYRRYDSEDQLNAGASFAAVVQPDADTQIRAKAQYLRGHEDRGTGDSVFLTLDRPVAFDLIDTAVAVNKRYERWFGSVGASAVSIFYQNATLLGISADQSYRDVVIPTGTARVGYVVAPLTSIFVDVTGNFRQFRYEPLSSNGYRVVGGVLFEPGPGARVKGEIYAGYIHQTYSGPSLQTISTWTAGGAISFLLTDQMTATFEGRREAKEAGLLTGVSLIESSVGGRIDYQLLDNFVVGAGATYLIDEYKGFGRVDRYVSPLASARYTVSKNVTVGVDYRMLDFKANSVGADAGFRRNVVLAAVNVRF